MLISLCLFSILLLINACTDLSSVKNQINPENSLTFENGSTLSNRLFGTWSTPELISQQLSDTASLSSEITSSVALSNNSNGFLAWSIEETTAIGVSVFSEVFSRDINSKWINNTPAIGITQSPPKKATIAVQTSNGNAIAVWQEADAIYSSFFTLAFGWNLPVLHGQGNKFFVSKNINNNLLLIWQNETQSSTLLNASFNDAQTGWTNKFSLTLDGKIAHTVSSPVKLENGSFLFSWIEDTSGILSLRSARLDPALGWTMPIVLSDNNVDNIDLLELAIDVNTNSAKLFYQTRWQSNPYGIFVSDYQFNLGFDENWSAATHFFDPNINATPSTHLEFSVAYNAAAKNNITIIWTSDVEDGVNQYHSVKISRYNSDIGWSEPMVIATPLFRFPFASPPQTETNNYNASPRITLNTNGQMHATWIEVLSNIEQIKSTSLSLDETWSNVEIITTNDRFASTQNLSISNNIQNEAQILWVQKFSGANGVGYELYTSNKEGSGIIDQPIIFHPMHPKPNFHISSTDNCFACHSETGIVINVDHGEVIGTCADCHNNAVAIGQSPSHILTTNACVACHSTSGWVPAIVVDHSEVIGSCASCHNGIIASGQSLAHISTTDLCEACHSTTMWAPVIRVDHAELIGACDDCHNGIIAIGRHVAHIPVSNICDACHVTTSFVPFTVDHNEVVGTCESCHSLAPATHTAVGVISQCDTCHSTVTWLNPTMPLPQSTLVP